jgi:hypothetical protein
MDEIERATALVCCHQYLKKRGIDVHIVHNLDAVDGMVTESSKPYLTPLMSPAHNDLTAGNSVWLAGIKSGDPVMLGGARLEHVGPDGIGPYWARSLQRAYSGAPQFKIANVDSEIARRVRGDVVYFGDMYVDRKCGAGILGARAFTAIGHLVTSARWSQNWTYAFLHDRDATRGAGLRYGLNWFVPQPFQWDAPPPTRSDTEWCGFLSAPDMPAMIRSTVRALSDNE